MKYVVCILVFLFSFLQGSTIGSDSAVTRFNTQQTVNNGDRIAGFAALNGGFALATNSTFGIFDSFFSVEGQVDLNFGTLVLSTDLIFHNVAIFDTLGNIVGNSHALNLAPSMNVIPLNSSVSSCAISLLNDIAPNTAVRGIDWNFTSTYIAIAEAATVGNTVQIYNWNGSSLSLTTGVNPAAASVNVNDVSWHPTLNWLAVVKDNSGAGSDLFIYQLVNQTLSLFTGSVNLGGNGHDVKWRPDGNFVAYGFVGGARLAVRPVSGTGVLGAAINSAPNPGATVNTVSWNIDGTFVAIGTAAVGGGNELQVYSFNGTTLAQNATFSIGAGINVLSVAWNQYGSNTNIIAVGTDTTPTLRLFSFSSGTLTELVTEITLTTPVNSLSWRPNGTCLSVGTTTGVNTYAYSNNLTLLSGITFGTNVGAVSSSHDSNYLAVGLNTPLLDIYAFNQLVSFSNVFFNDIDIVLNSDVTFKDVSITFSGSSSINGQGNTITLAPTFTLIVKEGGSLLLQNVTFDSVNNSKIQCLSSLSTVSLQDVTFILDNNFTFTQGKLDILGNFKISGSGSSFIYTANNGITIRGGYFGSSGSSSFYTGSLLIDNNVTFSYAPTNNASNLITMESSVSKLVLNSGTLIAQSLQLINGTLLVGGSSTLQGLTAITLGNGALANDLNIEILPAANLNLLGNIVYNNV